MEDLLSVNNVTITFRLKETSLTAVDNISFSLQRGERMGIVGESGAGKSLTGFALLNLLPSIASITSGNIVLDGVDITRYTQKQMEAIRGNVVSMVMQDSMSTLNPVLTIGEQITETILAHKKVSKSKARAMATEMLEKVCIPSPEERLRQYPHQFSGGMRQRIVIAIALATKPKLIIADEPTTALDVTLQSEIMSLLLRLCQEEGVGLLLVTHDLGVVAQMTEKIMVMYAGTIVEMGATQSIIHAPTHPYTQGLLASLPENADPTTRRLHQIAGAMPSLAEIPKGCPFYTRCPHAQERCIAERPRLEPHNGVYRACFYPDL